ncbi:hypothetical protein [Streptomyces sp. bgisy031]|uniref:hypothetical protein n=1 Tax=Streptomyces sp. bgisy031 TaxID=3413772 RepID=UPI003D752DC8
MADDVVHLAGDARAFRRSGELGLLVALASSRWARSTRDDVYSRRLRTAMPSWATKMIAHTCGTICWSQPPFGWRTTPTTTGTRVSAQAAGSSFGGRRSATLNTAASWSSAPVQMVTAPAATITASAVIGRVRRHSSGTVGARLRHRSCGPGTSVLGAMFRRWGDGRGVRPWFGAAEML